ncbi:MAG: hypothetical protein GY775_16710 [Candidatus Scalindua sp.]|nr:hypothetical protein [Candidatus Scalindua sp.]
MTRFQALYVLWLRHESMGDCSYRTVASRYFKRYRYVYHKVVPMIIGNQLDGMELELQAFKILVPDSLFRESVDLYEINLGRIHPSFNIKRHLNKLC